MQSITVSRKEEGRFFCQRWYAGYQKGIYSEKWFAPRIYKFWEIIGNSIFWKNSRLIWKVFSSIYFWMNNISKFVVYLFIEWIFYCLMNEHVSTEFVLLQQNVVFMMHFMILCLYFLWIFFFPFLSKGEYWISFASDFFSFWKCIYSVLLKNLNDKMFNICSI